MLEKNPKVSVIINTYNRAWHLKRLLDTLAKQHYENFEVVVVNGPSTDNTGEILEMYKDAVKIKACPVVNLCISRNIGIKASNGDIVAFIDDDAIPGSKYWIENAVSYFFKDENVGAVGGEVRRINEDIEFSCGYFNKRGENFVIGNLEQNYNKFEDDNLNRVAGGNAFFKKSILLEIGGFDEYYIYYLDETDVCLRLIANGYRVLHHPDALIYHEAAGGANRKSEYHLNWPVISKSLAYFIIKATENQGLTNEERIEMAKTSPTYIRWLNDFNWMIKNKKISKDDYNDFLNAVKDSQKKGIADAFSLERRLDFSNKNNEDNFMKYRKDISSKFLNIVMLCEFDVLNPVGGIPMYTNMIAMGLVKKGHNIHIVSKDDCSIMKNVNGLNIYTVTPEHLPVVELELYPNCHRIADFSYACYRKIKQLDNIYRIDIIETPIWDAYGLVSAHLSEIPIVTRLQTPLKMVLNTFEKEQNSDMSLLMEYEKDLLLNSNGIISISDSVKNTVEKLYDIAFTQPLTRNYLGINPNQIAISNRKPGDERVIIFFVGRLERRKGIDSIIASIPYILEKYPQVEYHLAGDSEIFDDLIGDTYKNKLLKENKGKKWLNRVVFMGNVNDETKEQEFANCDIFVSPSLYESFGIVFIEAMRYGKPVIGCNAGGMPEIIEDTVTGLLCEPGDGKSFTDALERLVVDKDERVKMGQAGLNRQREYFTDDIMCEGTLQFYKEVISRV